MITKLRPLLNPDFYPKGDMWLELTMLEGLCRAREKWEVTEEEVREFLRERGRPDLAEEFNSRHLHTSSDDP